MAAIETKNHKPEEPRSAIAPKTHTPKKSELLDDMGTYDPGELANKLFREAPEGTERIVDPTRRKLIQVVPLSEEKMTETLAEVLEDDRYEHFNVKLTFPTKTTWLLTLGTLRTLTDDNDKQFKGGRQEVGGNRFVPIEEFTRSIYTVITRYASVKKNQGKLNGGLGVVNKRTDDAA